MCLIMLLLALPIQAGILASERITYQGRLLQGGSPVTGPVDMTFSLWENETGGIVIASQSISDVEVSLGLFQVELTFGQQSYADGLWLQVQADGLTLTPRQRVTAVPLALHALSGGGFWELNGSFLTHDGPVSIASSEDSGLTVSANEVGIEGSGNDYGVYGTALSNEGYGVYAFNASDFGAAMGASGYIGLSVDAGSVGVSARGADIGVFGSTDSANGFGGFFAGEPGSRSVFSHPVGIEVVDPTAMLEINGSGVNNNGRALRVSVNDDEKFVIGNLGTSIYQPVFLEGTLTLTNFVGGGSIDVCRTGSAGFPGQLAACSSSARYKTDIASLSGATDLVERLRPVNFRWTESGEEDFGLVAEEVAAVEPRLATYSAHGQVEGVKYRQLSALLIRALQEQQQEIDRMRADLHILTQQVERSGSFVHQLESSR